MVIGIIASGLICGTAFAAAPVVKKQAVKIQPAPVSSQTAPGGMAPPSGPLKTQGKIIPGQSKIIMSDIKASIGCSKEAIWTLVDFQGKRLGNKTITSCDDCTIEDVKNPGYASKKQTDALGNLHYWSRPYEKTGTHRIRAYFAGDETAPAASGSCVLTITKAGTKVELLEIKKVKNSDNMYEISGYLWRSCNPGLGALREGLRIDISVKGTSLGWAGTPNDTGPSDPNLYGLGHPNWGGSEDKTKSLFRTEKKVPANLVDSDGFTVVARFPGNENYMPSMDSIKFKIMPAGQMSGGALKAKVSAIRSSSKILMADFKQVRRCSDDHQTWTLVDPQGNPLSNKRIRFCADCSASDVKTSPFLNGTDASGNIKLYGWPTEVNLGRGTEAGTYTLRAYFDGDETTPSGSCSCTATLLRTGTKIDSLCIGSPCRNDVQMGEKYTITGKLYGTCGSSPWPIHQYAAQYVHVSVNGAPIGWATMASTDYKLDNTFYLEDWTVPVTPTPGTLTITAIFPGDKNYGPSNTVSITCKTLPAKKPQISQ